jgi:FixJ family two-component response regulator
MRATTNPGRAAGEAEKAAETSIRWRSRRAEDNAMTTEAIVYVIDDDKSVCRALARLIQSGGLEVETFNSAEAFLKRTPARCPRCLVLEVRLPGTSGLDLQASLGRDQAAMPIIFVTGHGNVPLSVRAMKNGALDFLQKPFHDQELLDAIQRALARSRIALSEQAECASIQGRLATLTPRERQVLGLVVRGMLNKHIADELGAAEKTIRIHRGRAMKKMQANSVAEVVTMTHKIGLVDARV